MINAVPLQPSVWLDRQATYYKWLVTGTVLLAGATQTFAGNSVNLAIPRMMAAFGTDLATAQWVATTFLIARTLMVPVLGWLGGFLGQRNLFVVIMIGFVLTSIGCGLSVDIHMLIICRLAQGLVLGPIEGLTAVLMVQAFPPEQRGMAIGLRSIGWSAGQIVSFTLVRAIRQQIDTEAVAAGFRDSFFAMSVCFLLAMLCMIGVVRVHQPTVRKGA